MGETLAGYGSAMSLCRLCLVGALWAQTWAVTSLMVLRFWSLCLELSLGLLLFRVPLQLLVHFRVTGEVGHEGPTR